jgi:hypothetical protein
MAIGVGISPGLRVPLALAQNSSRTAARTFSTEGM